jgi:hypothetical protein
MVPMPASDDNAGRALRLPGVRRLRATALIVWGAASVLGLAWPLFSAFAEFESRSGLLFVVVGAGVGLFCWIRSDHLQRRAIASWVAADEMSTDAATPAPPRP